MKGITIFALLAVALTAVAAAPQQAKSSLLQDKLNKLKLNSMLHLKNRHNAFSALSSTLEFDHEQLDKTVFIGVAFTQQVIESNFVTLLLLMTEHEDVQTAIVDIMYDTFNNTAMGYFDFSAQLQAAVDDLEIRKLVEDVVTLEKNIVATALTKIQNLVDESASEFTDITTLVAKYTNLDVAAQLQPILDFINSKH